MKRVLLAIIAIVCLASCEKEVCIAPNATPKYKKFGKCYYYGQLPIYNSQGDIIGAGEEQKIECDCDCP